MKIALCTSDFFYPVHESIRNGGHEVKNVFTSCALDTGFSDKTLEFAKEMRADFRVGQVSPADVRALEDAGVELLISAAYDYKIPTPKSSKIKFINVHGSLLPEGRGPWPQPWTILKYPEHAGVTLHSMTDKWDHGDIVLQREIRISDDEHLDSFIAKTLVCVRELTEELLANFYEIWNKRRPMEGEGSYWRRPTEEDRTITFDRNVGEISKIRRAFGDFTLFKDPENGEVLPIDKLTVWAESHSHAAGRLITISPPIRIYALSDGYLSVVPRTIPDKQ